MRKGERFLEYIEAHPGTGAMEMFRALHLTSGGNMNHNLNYSALTRLVKSGAVRKFERKGRVYLYPPMQHHELHTDNSNEIYE